MGQLGDDVDIDGEILRQGGAHRLVILHHRLLIHGEIAGGDHAHAVGADLLGVLSQPDGLVLVHGAHVDEHRDAPGGLLYHRLGHQFPLLGAHEIHLAGGTAGIQTLHTLLDQILRLRLQRSDIHLVVRGEGSGHSSDHAVQLFHWKLLLRFPAFVQYY